MSAGHLALVLANLALIAALPRVFFRKGRLNARWWATAAPFFLAGALALAAGVGALRPLRPAGAGAAFGVAGAALSAASLVLIGYAMGSNRVPLSLWHQDDDAPREVVTWGAYRRIRHPFYTAFLMALGGVAGAAPHPLTLAPLVWSAVALNLTARREERRLRASALGADYEAYMAGTGRFVPRLGRGDTAA